MFKTIRIALRHFLSSCGYILGTCVMSLWRRPSEKFLKNKDISVHMLVSSKTWHAGLLAAMSFEFFTERRWNFFIHEDGSVNEIDRKKIEKVFPGVRFVSRKESEERVQKYLEAHPLCVDHRKRHNLFLKFFDVPSFAEERFIFLDSDVIFFRKPQEILDWADDKSEAFLYNEDSQEKYCIPRNEIETAFKLTLLPRFNSGLMLLPKKSLSLDCAEDFLKTFESIAHHPQFFEQTLYAVMATQSEKAKPLPLSYEISWNFFRKKNAIARHYIGVFKNDILYLEAPVILLWELLKNNILQIFKSRNDFSST